MRQSEIRNIIDSLSLQHPDAECELNYNTPFELLVAVILSAQCTDKRVNIITGELFKHYDTPAQFAAASQDELIPYIRSCGYYRSKSRAVIEASAAIMERFNGEVPKSVEELMTLRGVGRKTANVVYSVAFGGDAIAVDTHVQRVSNRIGLADSDKVSKTEEQLTETIPKDEWSKVHHLLIHHGRYVCRAQKPKCSECIISPYCRYYNSNK